METSQTTGARVLEAFRDLSDEEVVRRVRAGETALFEVLMRRYNQRIFRVARSILREDSEAEDVMQQAYVNAYLCLDQFEGRARFSTWLTRIAVHEASARAKRRRRLCGLDEAQWLAASYDASGPAGRPPGLDPEQEVLMGEVRRALEAAIETLPEAHRCVFVLREVEGLSTLETADCLGVSPDLVKTRMHRARRRLQAELLKCAELTAPQLFSFHLSRCDRVVAGVFRRLGAIRAIVH
jgi:RNA polymerase sigma-70 factor (ECF subfamily)